MWKICSIACIFLAIPLSCNGCQGPSDWHRLNIEEILRKTDTVILGKEVERKTNPNGFNQDAIIDVYCILKNTVVNLTIAESITIEEVYPHTSCDVTYDGIGVQMIAAIKPSENGNFKWDVVGLMQRATFKPSKCNFQRILYTRALDPKNFLLPDGTSDDNENRCPNPDDYDHSDEDKYLGWPSS